MRGDPQKRFESPLMWNKHLLHQPLTRATGVQNCGAKRAMASLGGRITGLGLETLQDSPNFDGTSFVNGIETRLGSLGVGLA